MEQVRQLLTQQFQVNDADWKTITSYFETVTLEKDVYLVQMDKICRNAAFILEGVVRYYAYEDNGDEQSCYFAAENDFIVDPFSFPTQIPAKTFNLQTITNCKLAVISFDRHTELAKIYPQWINLFNALVQRAMAEFINQKIVISYDAGKRYEYFVTNYPQFAQRVPLQYVASYLGITQPSLSRLRSKLAKGEV